MTSRRPSILWIGRMRFSPVVRIREVELFQEVARHARVVALDRTEARGWGEPGLVDRLRLRYDLASSGWKVLESGEATRFRMPVVMATGPLMIRLAARINDARVREALRRFDCDTVFHSSPIYFMPAEPGRRRYRCHFDLVDNFFDGYPDTSVGRARHRFLRDAMLRSDTLSTVSHRLCDRVEALLGRRPAYVPNGAALDQIRSWPASRRALVRQRLGLRPDDRALVYVGNYIRSFDGMEMLLPAFLAARESRRNLVLILVGPGSDRVPRERGVGADDGVRVVGPVPREEVWDYVHAADLGLLPRVPNPGMNDCMPLKVIEFGAAGKPMLTTPLGELETLRLPHVRFAPYDAEAWRAALLEESVYASPDASALARELEPFSWERVSADLLRTITSPG